MQVVKDFRIKLGGNVFVNCGSLISVEGVPLFHLYRRENDGALLIDFEVFDKEGNRVAIVRNSNPVDTASQRVEVEHGATVKRIIDKHSGQDLVRVDKRPNGIELDVCVDTFLPKTGIRLNATPDSINIGGLLMIGSVISGNKVGIGIGECGPGVGIRLRAPN